MALSKRTASEIVKAVSRDPNCKDAIDSVLAYFLPDDFGWAGGVRNFMMVFADSPNYALEDIVNAYRRSTATKGDKTERYVAPKLFPREAPRVDRLICTGIAEATAKVINSSLKTSTILSGTVESANMTGRNTGIAHAGTLVKMLDGSKYIFDWHMTLSVGNPLIFRAENWHQRTGGKEFDKFIGFR